MLPSIDGLLPEDHRSTLASLGAQWSNETQRPDENSLPTSFGDPEREARALHESCAVSLSSNQRLDLEGSDRGRFLQGQVTCDVEALQSGEGTYGFFTTAKGRIEADVVVCAAQDRLILSVPFGTAPNLAQRLEKYVLIDDVRVLQPPSAALLLCGAEAESFLNQILEEPVADSPWSGLSTTTLSGSSQEAAWVLRRQDLGAPAFEIWLRDPQHRIELFSQFIERGALPAGTASLEALRIAVGEPRFGADFGPKTLPQETGREDAVSYTKGCYLGQEVVARLHYRGQVAKQIRSLRLEGPDLAGMDLDGAELQFEGRSAGRLTSITAWGPPNFESHPQRRWALAMVARRAFDSGTELQLTAGARAVVL
ncbi:MAG: hypothetical protein AAGD01_00055 [Acidobacteriota bacterium]